jgi:hypothetical protein
VVSLGPGADPIHAAYQQVLPVTVMDMVFVTRTSDGRFRITDLDENHHDIGLGSLEIRTQPLIREDDLDVLRDSLKPGTSAAVIAYEHSWVGRLAGAVAHAGGTIIRTEMIGGTASVTADPVDSRAAQPAGPLRRMRSSPVRTRVIGEVKPRLLVRRHHPLLRSDRQSGATRARAKSFLRSGPHPG